MFRQYSKFVAYLISEIFSASEQLQFVRGDNNAISASVISSHYILVHMKGLQSQYLHEAHDKSHEDTA